MVWRRRTAFTLIELLVVIAIISLLIAILLPALKRARDSALVVQCASNLRQWGITINAYSAENRGTFPCTASLADVAAGHQPTMCNVQSNDRGELSVEMLAKFLPGVDMNKRILGKVWICPAADFPGWEDLLQTDWAFWDSFDMEYAYYAHIDIWPSIESNALAISTATARQLKSDRVLMTDQLYRRAGSGRPWMYNHGRSGGSNAWSGIYGGGFIDFGPPQLSGMNVLHGDGSVTLKVFPDTERARLQADDPTLPWVYQYPPNGGPHYTY